MRTCRGERLLGIATALLLAGCLAAAPSSPAWQTCAVTEGKGSACGAGERPRPFQDFLKPGEWSNTISGWFTGDFLWDLKQFHRFRTKWYEAGTWGAHSIRIVRYMGGDSTFGGVILVEGSRNIFSPLMKWSGDMPEPLLYEHDGIQVLVLTKDQDARVPVVSMWAWTWSNRGPIQLDIDGAMAEAIQKVAPGYHGLLMGFDWEKLHGRKWVWKGDFPGTMGVSHIVEAWFELGDERLVVQRAKFSPLYSADSSNDGVTVRWPPESKPVTEERLGPVRKEIAVTLMDASGTPAAGVELRLKQGVSVTTNGKGMASIPLPSPLAEGTPVLLEPVTAGGSMVIVSPCRGVVPVSDRMLTIVVARRGQAVLRQPLALEALADCVLRIAATQEKYAWALYNRYRKEALHTVARSVGVPAAALDEAIRSWERKTTDPLHRGLIALYEQRTGDAVAALRRAKADLADPSQLGKVEFYLARALYAQRNFAQSIAAHERAAALCPNETALLSSWAWALTEMHDSAAAESHLRRAFSIEESLFGSDAASTGRLARFLASVVYSRANYAEAERLNRKALAIAEKNTGPDSVETAEALHELAVVAIARSDNAAAKPLLLRALRIREAKLGRDDRETAETVAELGLLLYHQRDSCPEAFPLFRRALAVREKAFGPKHPVVASSMNMMGLCFEETGDSKAAEEHYQRAISIAESTVGAENVATADYMSNLASLLVTLHREPDAEAMQRRALRITEAILGPEHPRLIDTAYKLGFVLNSLGRQEEAIQFLSRAAAIQERAFGPETAELARIQSNLAALLINASKNAQAEPLLRRVLAIQERTVGANHRDTAKSLNDLAILLDRKGDSKEAAELFGRALSIYRNLHGADSQEARSAEENLRQVRNKLNK